MNSCVKMAHKFEYFHRQHENRNFLENPLHFHWKRDIWQVKDIKAIYTGRVKGE